MSEEKKNETIEPVDNQSAPVQQAPIKKPYTIGMPCVMEEDKTCDGCEECVCDLDASKICDSCCKCIKPTSDYAEIMITEIIGL